MHDESQLTKLDTLHQLAKLLSIYPHHILAILRRRDLSLSAIQSRVSIAVEQMAEFLPVAEGLLDEFRELIITSAPHAGLTITSTVHGDAISIGRTYYNQLWRAVDELQFLENINDKAQATENAMAAGDLRNACIRQDLRRLDLSMLRLRWPRAMAAIRQMQIRDFWKLHGLLEREFVAAAAKLRLGAADATVGLPSSPSPTQQVFIIDLGRNVYSTSESHQPVMVTPLEDLVLQAFIKQPAMDSKDLIRFAAGSRTAPRVLAELTTKYGGIFAPAIRLPGGKGRGGYRVNVRRLITEQEIEAG